MPAPDVVAIRRQLHRIPELFFREHTTQAAVRELVGDYLDVRTIGGTGLVADIGPADAQTTLLLRADMDGLPVTEETGLAFASEHAGRMHACGHDAHMAALVAASRLLAAEPLDGLRLRFLFQPAEEGAGGARVCIAEGLLDGVDAAFGLHVWNELPVGTVAVTPGGIMAGVVELAVTVEGRGGHGAMPDRTTDPVVAAAQLVLAFQTVASRMTSPFEPVVVSIGSVHGGDAFNVIPETVTLRGTVRTFSAALDATVEEQLRRVAAGIAAATGTTIGVEWTAHGRPTCNAPGMSRLVEEAAATVPGLDTVLTNYRTMAGEDFGEIAARVPACFALVGSANVAKGLVEPHHSPRFAIDEAVLPLAAELHVAVAKAFAAQGAVRPR